MANSNAFIVGIGASAGGIPALETFFRHLGTTDRFAFVVITHLSPDRPSRLHEVIASQSALPVEVAKNGRTIKAGHIYVMPERSILTVEDGALKLETQEPPDHERRPIDIFFSALAADQGENAIGIILSGGDSDGTLGFKAIKERGGVTFAQGGNGSSPRNPQMPASAIAAGLVDYALPAEEMPQKLARIAEFGKAAEPLTSQAGPIETKLATAQKVVSGLLRTHAGHDFSGYKTKTFVRRLARRMKVNHDVTLDAYLDRLRQEPEEVMALFRDLLINVTEFFRDPEAFRALQSTVIPQLFEGRGADETIRVWLPGCSTGEEVYSVGILMLEELAKQKVRPRVQIFATDIDEHALAAARAGRYPEQLMSGLSDARRSRYFRKDGATHVVAKELRDLCVFSPHSIIGDPPFSRMDLLSCRNLLIYFGRELQDQVIPTFHYALKPGGYLFLGTSESISQHSDLFAVIDRKNHIYQSREHSRARPNLPMTLQASGRAFQFTEDNAQSANLSAYQLRQRVEAQVIERYAPAHVVVRSEGDIVYFSGRTSRFLEMPRGAPNRHLLDLVRVDLRLELRAALREAMETGRKVTHRAMIKDEADDHDMAVELVVEPLKNADKSESLWLVLFTPVRTLRSGSGSDAAQSAADEAAERSGRELRDLRERLQSTVEEYETALEELRSSNEELVSVNEEAQSTNEELEASKEEMQSLNEELTTINMELNVKVVDLDRAHSDLKNLYESTKVATVFLDGDLVIRNFTPSASSLFNLREADVGRPLTDLSNGLDHPHLREDIQQVFDTGEMLERQLSPNGEGSHFLARFVPYRGNDEAVTGVVVTVVDVTSLAEAEEHQRLLIEELNHRVKNMLAVVISIARATMRHSKSRNAFTDTFVDRLHGMARAYGLLSTQQWSPVAIGDLVEQELSAFDIARFDIKGPIARLQPEVALSFGLVIHELATNAAKYGALSVEKGRVAVHWSVAEKKLAFEWRESGGPTVTAPAEKGFGMVLIESQVMQRLEGKLECQFASDGFILTMSIPYTG